MCLLEETIAQQLGKRASTRYRGGVREAELWGRLEGHLGPMLARSWSATVVLGGLGDRTVVEALSDGVDNKVIWRAVWNFLELPASDR